VSLYHNLTSNNKLVAWYLNDITLNLRERVRTDGTVEIRKYKRQMERNEVAKQKYIDRGFTYVTKTCNDKPMGRFGGILRHIGDDKSYIIPLDRYLNVSSWTPTFDEHMDRLNYVSWIELDGRIEVISNPLRKYDRLDMSPEWFRVGGSLEHDDLYLLELAGEHFELSLNSC
jgi:hypothetical protein